MKSPCQGLVLATNTAVPEVLLYHPFTVNVAGDGANDKCTKATLALLSDA